MVSCVTPGAADGRTGAVTVELSINDGADFTSDGKMYMYEMGVTVSGLMPSWGRSKTAGQVVTVIGSHFEQSQELSCQFGLEGQTRGQYLSSSMVACTAPERGPGSVTVVVSNNADGGGRVRGASARFEYKAQVSPWAAEPSRGPTKGGTRVTVTGSIELLEAGDVDCIFGVERVPAEVTSKQAIVCTVPRSKTAGAVDLRLADASSDTTVGASVQFEYFVQPSVTAVMPSRGAVTGGTPVSVIGTGFPDDAGLRCRFAGGTASTSDALVLSCLLYTSPSPRDRG